MNTEPDQCSFYHLISSTKKYNSYNFSAYKYDVMKEKLLFVICSKLFRAQEKLEVPKSCSSSNNDLHFL